MEPALTVIIPTYNRPNSIKEILSNLLFENSFNIRIEIHDSSSNDETKKIVDEIVKTNVRFKKYIFYYYYSDNIYVDDKVFYAFSNCQTKYIYLIGDGWVINFIELNKIFNKFINTDFDVLCLLHSKNFKQFFSLSDDEIHLDSSRQFFNNYLWYVTLYGSCITKKSIFIYTDSKDIYNKYKNSDFFYPCMIFDKLSNLTKCEIVIFKDDFISSGHHKVAAGWTVDGRMLEIWTYKFYKTVMKLPAFYNNKEDIIYNVGIQSRRYSLVSLLRYRYFGNLTLKLLKKHKEYIKKVTNKYSLMIMVALCPKWLLKPFYIFMASIRHRKY